MAGKIIEVLADQAAIMDVGAKDGLRSGMVFVRENRLRP